MILNAKMLKNYKWMDLDLWRHLLYGHHSALINSQSRVRFAGGTDKCFLAPPSADWPSSWRGGARDAKDISLLLSVDSKEYSSFESMSAWTKSYLEWQQ